MSGLSGSSPTRVLVMNTSCGAFLRRVPGRGSGGVAEPDFLVCYGFVA